MLYIDEIFAATAPKLNMHRYEIDKSKVTFLLFNQMLSFLSAMTTSPTSSQQTTTSSELIFLCLKMFPLNNVIY